MDDLLAYFAAHAPETIPGWFAGPPLPQRIAPTVPDPIKDRTVEWLLDPCYDLEDAFPAGSMQAELARDFRFKAEAFNRACHQDKLEQVPARYIAWRWHYARLMVLGRNNIGGD